MIQKPINKEFPWKFLNTQLPKNPEFELPIGRIVCECGITHFIYPDMVIPEIIYNKKLKCKKKNLI
jgi:hypothetical protein